MRKVITLACVEFSGGKHPADTELTLDDALAKKLVGKGDARYTDLGFEIDFKPESLVTVGKLFSKRKWGKK